MPSPETFAREQPATLWRKTGVSQHGLVQVSAPEEVYVRWNQTTKMGTGADGQPVQLSAEVVTVEEVPIGSLMFLGELAEWLGTGSEGLDDQVHEVIGKDGTYDVKGRAVSRSLSLVKFRDAVPAPT